MNLRVKLMASFLVISALIVIVGVVGILESQVTTDSFGDIVEESAPSLSALGHIEAAANEMRETAIHHHMNLLMKIPSIEAQEYDSAKAELEDWLAVYEADTDDAEDLEALEEAKDKYVSVTRGLLDLAYAKPTSDNILAALEVVESVEEEFKAVLEEAVVNETAEFESRANIAVTAANSAKVFYLIAMIGVLAGGTILGLVLTRLITGPVVQLESVARKMSQGDYNQRAIATGADEIGQLGLAFNNMADTVQQRDSDLRELNANLEKRVDERTAELRRANALAKESVRLKSEFMSTMSHELRTPLNAILGFSGIMLEGMGGEMDDDAHHMVERIDSNSQRLLGLINDILDLAKIEAGRMELTNQPFTPTDLARRWRSQVGVLGEKKGLQFEVNLDPSLPDILYGDPERITQIVANLLSNAFKFTETGKVKLDMERAGENWLIRVTDTGIGIPPHALNYIFDEFRQVDGTTTRAYGGSGLGLAIVRSMCRMMSGTVQVTSELGKGSVFTVTLPLKTEDPEAKADMLETA